MNRAIGLAHTRLALCLAIGLLALLAACAGSQPPVAAQAQAEVQFLDTGGFDRKLSSALASGQPEVTVVFPAAITLNSIPARLDKWFSKVEKFGGRVDIQAEPEPDRGIISEIFGLFIKVYDTIEEAVIYSPAKNYNVLIHYKSQTGLVTRVSFTRKVQKEAPAAATAANETSATETLANATADIPAAQGGMAPAPQPLPAPASPAPTDPMNEAPAP